jgi:uncharacterized protein YllA (UPF0747 family)
MAEWSELDTNPDGTVEANGKLAAVIPEYSSDELTEADMQALIDETDAGESPVVIVDGEIGRLTE